MKRTLLFIALLLSVAMFAAKEDTYVLYTGFEGGVIPEGWTQETVVGNRLFTVEAGTNAINPEGAFAGDYRLLIRNESGQTDHAVTRLYTPVIHGLDTAALPMILVFSHAQMHWTGDVDVLKIYYRNSLEDNAKWIPVEGGEFTSKIQEWTTDTLYLTGNTTNDYQLCFEVMDNMGRGVVLDDIIVRTEPQCLLPQINISGLTGQSASIFWTGSLDAESFHFILATEDAANPEKIENPVINEVLDGETLSFETGATLERSTTYYVYIKSLCLNEETEWAKASFTTKTFFSLPYTEHFDLPAATNMPMVKYWTRGTNKKDASDIAPLDIPYVNVGKGENYFYKYSPNATTALAFALENSAFYGDTPFPENQYAYAATPELGIDNIKNIEVSFWGTAAEGVGCVDAIIVGAMSDPANYSTFVPADTIYPRNMNCIENYTVYFDKVNSTADLKYIAFVTDFDKPNVFYIDDVVVKEAPAAKRPIDLKINEYHSQSFVIDANLCGSPKCNIVATKVALDKNDRVIVDLDAVPAEDIIKTVTDVTLPYTFTFEDGMAVDGQFVEVYVIGVNGTATSAPSFPLKVHMPKKMGTYLVANFDDYKNGYPTWHAANAYNYFTSEEVYTPTSSQTYKTQFYYGLSMITGPNTLGKWPELMNNYGYSNSTCFNLRSWGSGDTNGSAAYEPGYSQYVALGEVEDVTGLTLSWYVSKTTLSTKNVPTTYAIGMMTDPYDIFTFDTIATYTATAALRSMANGYNEYDLSQYKGKGRYPAIMAIPSGNGVYISNLTGPRNLYSDIYVDEFMVASPDKCAEPRNIKATDVTFESAKITWDAGRMTTWSVVILEQADTVSFDTVTTNSYEVKGLKPDTQYSFGVSTICTLDGGEIAGIGGSFLTKCAAYAPVPFYENFDARSSNPQCWRSVGAGNVGTMSSKKMWQLSTATSKQDCYIELPHMDKALNELQLSFDLFVSTAAFVGAKVHVVAMDSAANMDTLKTFTIKKSGVYENCIVSFRNYQGNGEFMAIVRDSAYTSVFIPSMNKESGYEVWLDNVAVELLPPCELITGVNVFNQTTTGATVEWNTGDATEWEVAITKSPVDLAETTDNVTILSATQMPFTFSNKCEPGTDYYVAVRSVCDKNTKGDWSEYATFQTLCTAVTPEDLGVVDFSDKNTLKCWTVGSRSGDEVPTCAEGYLVISNKAGAAYDGGYAFMQQLDVADISEYQVSFVAHGGTSTTTLHKLTVGIATQPDGTMTEVQTIDLNTVTKVSAFKEGKRYVVRFNNYRGDINGVKGKYIGFMSNSGASANDIYIDDVVVSKTPQCWEPSVLTIDTMTVSSVTLAWENVEETSYEVKIAKANGTVFSLDTVTPVGLDATDDVTFTVNGLSGCTTYKAYVRSICAGGYSEYAPVVTFTTGCPDVMPVPYEQCFDYSIISTTAPYTGVECLQTWSQIEGGAFKDGTASGAYAYVKKDAAKSSLGGLYMGSTYGSSAKKPTTSFAVLPTFGKPAGQLMLSFDYNKATYSNLGYIGVGIADTVSTPEAMLRTITWIDTVALQKETYNASGYPWYHYSKALDNYTGNGEYIILAAIQGNGVVNNVTLNYIYIDNVFVENIPTCFRPLNVTATGNTATSVSFTWDPAGAETQWDVTAVSAEGDIDPSNFTTVNTSSATIENLLPASDYDVYVRANCGGGDVSSWSHVCTMSTLCRTDYSGMLYNFDNEEDRIANPYPYNTSYPDWDGCWMQGSPFDPVSNLTYVKNSVPRMTGTYQKTYALYGHSDLYAIEFGTQYVQYDGGYIVSPEIVGNLDTMQVSFWMRAGYTKMADGSNYTSYSADGYARSIKVGTMTDPNDFSTFELLADVQTAKMEVAPDPEGLEYWRQFNIPLYQAAGKYVVLLSKYAPEKNTVYVDDIEFGKVTGVPMPTAVKSDYDKLNYNHIEFVWKSALDKFKVVVKQGDEFIKDETITGATRYIVDGLTESTEYTFTVIAVNAAGEESVPVTIKSSTPCVPTDQYNAYWDFSSDLEQFGSSDAYMMPACWTVGCLSNNSSDTYKPAAKANTTTAIYAHGDGKSVTERALYFYSLSTYYGNYAIMPQLDIDLSDKVLDFYMRNSYTSASNDKFSQTNSTYNDLAKSIVIGYIVNDDINTFVPVHTEKYATTLTTSMVATTDGDLYWQHVSLPLSHFAEGVNKYRIVFMYNQGNAVTGYMCIDDVAIVNEGGCPGISGLSVERKATSATFSWKTDATSSRVQVATDNEFENIVADQIVENATTYTATGLAQGTTYHVRVQSYCSALEASPFANQTFVTYCAPRYFEGFDVETITPANWWRAGNATDYAVYSGTKLTPETNEVRADIWQHDNDRGDMFVRNININNNVFNWWLISPEFDFTDFANDSILFSVDLALESSSHGEPNPVRPEDMLSLSVSLDGGQNWFAEDMICKWQNKNGSTYSYNKIKKTPTRFYIDITKYAGRKNVVFAFYSTTLPDSVATPAINNLRMDNIQVNTFNTKVDKQTACQWNDFKDEYFTVYGDEMRVGLNTAEVYSLSNEDGVNDQLVKLELTVTAAATTSQNYRICEGEDYTNDNFNIKGVTSSNIYKQKLGGATSCDSIVVLDLAVIPTQTGDVEATICSGNYYEFGGEKYYTSQPNLTKTFKSVEGCDSIVTLHLTVNPIIEGEMQEVYLCEGSSFVLGDQTITEAGEYTSTVKTENGCDSIAKAKVIMAPVYNISLRTAICHGSKYPYAPFENMSVQGTYKSESTSQYGCDSIITLRLLVADIDNVIYDTIEVEDLPYMVNDSIILPVGTALGSHNATITLDCGVTNMVIQVGEKTDLGKLEVNTLKVPNPVMVGQSITVMTDFTDAQLRDMTLDVFSSTGMLVYRANPTSAPITIPGMPAAGMYNVRVTTGESVYNAKLIVK